MLAFAQGLALFRSFHFFTVGYYSSNAHYTCNLLVNFFDGLIVLKFRLQRTQVLTDEKRRVNILFYYLHFYNVPCLLDLIPRNYRCYIINTFGRRRAGVSRNSEAYQAHRIEIRKLTKLTESKLPKRYPRL